MDTDFAKRFGTQVKKARTELGLTQYQLASKLELSTNFISRMERGEALIHISTFEKFCEVLKKNANFFLPETEKYSTKLSMSDFQMIESDFIKASNTLNNVHKRVKENKRKT